MSWKFSNDKPIYLQVEDQIKQKIATNEYKSGDKLESVRELAIIAGVNPNTIQKALINLENEGLIITKRTCGKYITEDEKLLKKYKKNYLNSKIDNFINEMKNLGYDKNEIINILTKEGNIK